MINKVYVRSLMARTIVTWVLWKRAKLQRQGLRVLEAKNIFDIAVGEMAAYLMGFDPSNLYLSPIWREAFKISNMWLERQRVTTWAMNRLIKRYNEAFGRII